MISLYNTKTVSQLVKNSSIKPGSFVELFSVCGVPLSSRSQSGMIPRSAFSWSTPTRHAVDRPPTSRSDYIRSPPLDAWGDDGDGGEEDSPTPPAQTTDSPAPRNETPASADTETPGRPEDGLPPPSMSADRPPSAPKTNAWAGDGPKPVAATSAQTPAETTTMAADDNGGFSTPPPSYRSLNQSPPPAYSGLWARVKAARSSAGAVPRQSSVQRRDTDVELGDLTVSISRCYCSI